MLDTYLKECMYFTVSRLDRIVTKMAEDEFRIAGLSPTYAYLLMAVDEKEGISQKELGAILHLQPSTVTRLVEKLVVNDLVYTRMEGRMSLIYTSPKGKQLIPVIHNCWESLRGKYNSLLGGQQGDQLAMQLHQVCERLDNIKS